MNKRDTEGIGPVLNGLESWQPAPEPEPVAPEWEPDPVEEVMPDEHTVLVCGADSRAEAVARLAADCGFLVRRVFFSPEEADDSMNSILLEEDDDFVQGCEVGRNHFVCLFLDDPALNEKILLQCLTSDAMYLGAWADDKTRHEIFQRLRSAGAPDAELAAVCCPMGLPLAGESPEQDAVAVVAELLAAKAGVLKRLRAA